MPVIGLPFTSRPGKGELMELRNCPKCSTSMDFRLGEFDCPSCGYKEPADKKAQQEQPAQSGPGFKQQWTQPGRSSPGTSPPPPPAPGTMYQPGQQLTDTPYGPPAFESDRFKSLHTEKNVCFGLIVASSFFHIIGALFALGNEPLGGIFGLFIILFSLFLWWFVLYGTAVWSKYCCLIILVFGLVSNLIGGAYIFMSGDMLASGLLPPGIAVMMTIMFVVSVAVSAWVMSIIYRDIQQLQGS